MLSEMTVPVDSEVSLRVSVGGTGRPLLLVHGWPHTRHLWDPIAPDLCCRHQVLAPDLRGVGDSTRARTGYDAATTASDLETVLRVAEVGEVDVVAIDMGVPGAFLLALRRPELVRRLVVMESTLGTLAGAEEFFAAGAPWWFGFHQAPGLAEAVLVGNEGAYLDFFYRTGTHDGSGIEEEIRDRFVAAYAGSESLSCGFAYYRAVPESSAQLSAAVATGRLRVPTMAIGARPVGDALARQLAPVTDDLRSEHVEDCGHIVPLDRPDALLALLGDFLDD